MKRTLVGVRRSVGTSNPSRCGAGPYVFPAIGPARESRAMIDAAGRGMATRLFPTQAYGRIRDRR